MAFQSLYRRFRPQRFVDVRGQDHVSHTLRNAVRDGKVTHAYLFSGPRGTGKTSSARILAKALNCANPDAGEPCGVCTSCVEIAEGRSLDVLELDAASNRGVDAMRDLVSRASLGTPGRWKVYIVDEVHMLTTEASNTLLKTLEEPPAHVIFVLATTEPQKVLPTIRSRTQHFEFHLVSVDVLVDHLRWVADQAGLTIPDEVIRLVAKRGAGSVRDALSKLDQVAAAGGIYDDAPSTDEIVEGLCERDLGRALVAVAERIGTGHDPRRLAVDLLEHLRQAFLATVARGLVGLPDDEVARMESQAARMGRAAIVRAMEVLGDALIAMRDAPDTRVLLEVSLVRLCRPEADVSPAAMLERIERLERKLAAGGAGGGGGQAPSDTPGGGGAGRPPPPAGPSPVVGTRGPQPGPARPPVRAGQEAPVAANRQADPSRPSRGAPHPEAGAQEAGAGRNPSRPSGSAPPAPTAPGPGAGTSPSAVGAPPPQAEAHGPGAGTAPPPIGAPPPQAEAHGPGAGTAPPPIGAAEAPAATSAPDRPPPVDPGGQPTPVTPPKEGPAAAARLALGGVRGQAGPARSSPLSRRADSSREAPPRPVRAADALPPPPTPASAPDSPGFPTRDDLTLAWGDIVLPALPPKARARYKAGRFVDVPDQGVAGYALPTAIHRERCAEVQGDVEQALAGHFGRRVPLKLLVEAEVGAVPPDEPDDDEHIDPRDLRDAPSAGVTSPVDHVMQAFEGATLVEE